MQIGLLFATLAGLATSIYTMTQGLEGADLVWAIVGAVVAAASALFVDRDGDGVPPILDEDQR